MLRFLLGLRDRRDSLGAKSKGKEMDKASALEEFLDIITRCPGGGDIRLCSFLLFTWEFLQALC